MLKLLNVFWKTCGAGFDRDDVEVLDHFLLVLVDHRIASARAEVLEDSTKGLTVVPRCQREDTNVAVMRPLKATKIFFGFLDLETPID